MTDVISKIYEKGNVAGLSGKTLLETVEDVDDIQELIAYIQQELQQIVISNTTEYWEEHPSIISKKNTFYVYTDYRAISGVNIPDIKLGDGTTPVVDLPFIDATLIDHINNTTMHTNQAEKEFWNNKVRCYSDDNNEKLIFTTN